MKHLIYFLLSICLLITIMPSAGQAGDNQKLGQSGFEFLRVSSDARAAALAGAVITQDLGSSALFYNPAGLALMQSHIDLSVSLNEWIADIKHQTIGVAFNPWRGRYGTLGFSFQSVDYGDVLGTAVDFTVDKGYRDTGVITPSAMAVGVGYAKALTDRFSVGGQIKWVHQDLGESVLPGVGDAKATIQNELSPLAFDFGTLFKTGIRSIAFGMTVRNFSEEIKYAEEGFQLPLMFTMGISADVFDFLPRTSLQQRAILSIAAVHHRSYYEQLMLGLDYCLMDFLSLRAGYITSSDENNISFGFGLMRYGLVLDYAYTPFGVFDNVQRVTARFGL